MPPERLGDALHSQPIIEAVCCSVEDALVAERAGASRIELCSAIELGGLTPSPGLVGRVRERRVAPTVAMVRPRPAGFNYSLNEIETMVSDASWLFEAGIDGIVFAALNSDRTIDVSSCRSILSVCPAGSQKVFHRAFDATPDLEASLEALIDLGFSRILTSGGLSTAFEGTATLRRLVQRADGRIEILPAGGIRAENARQVLEESGAGQLHLGPMRDVEDATGPFYGTSVRVLDGVSIEAVVAACQPR